MSIDPKSAHSKLATMGTGIFLLVFSVMTVVLDSSNFLAFGLAFFVLMIGIMLVMVGALNDTEKSKSQMQTQAQSILRSFGKL